jgi:hypothetical protein
MAEGNWQPPAPSRANVPAELRELQAFLIWRVEHDPGSDKALKVPFWSAGGRRYGKQGSPQDRAQLTTFAAAKEAAVRRGFDGVGFAPLPEFGVTALDFDHCIDADGNLPPDVEAITKRTYAERSPSGKGIRAFLKGDLGNRKAMPDSRYGWGFETFSSNAFVTVTGHVLEDTVRLGLENVLAPVDEQLTALCEKRFGPQRRLSPNDDFLDTFEPPSGMSETEIKAYLSDLDPSMGRDGWIKVGMALHHETEGEGFALWDEWSSDGHNYPGTEALERQWSSFSRREPEGRQVTLRTVIKMSNDVRDARGIAPRARDTIAQVAEKAREENPSPDLSCYQSPGSWDGDYPIISGGAFARRPSPEWIIKGFLPRADLGVIYGQSGAGKSFVALSIAMAICRGSPWRGLKVRQGRVLYVAAEGGGDVSQRLRAYAVHHGIDLETVPIGIVHGVPNLLDMEDCSKLVKSILAAGSGDLIILDTFAQVTSGGNENSGEDMGRALRHARKIGDATGSMILLVHHSGKDASRGARGWSGIRAACDVEMEVVRPEDGAVRTLRVSKQRSGRDDLSWGFGFERVRVGLDADGDEESSLVVVERDMPANTQKPMGKNQRLVFDAVKELSDGRPVTVDDVIVLALTRKRSATGPEVVGGRDQAGPNLKRALDDLVNRGDLFSDGERVSLQPLAASDEGKT